LTLQTLWKIDAPAHLSNILPFHEREARSISPGETNRWRTEGFVQIFDGRRNAFEGVSKVPTDAV
jgi:hypothetical protein